MKRKIILATLGVILSGVMVSSGINDVVFAEEIDFKDTSGACDESFLGFRTWYHGLTDDNCEIQVVDKDGKDSDGTQLAKFIWTIVLNVLYDIFVALGYLATGFIIYGGYLFIMSSGDPGKAAKGKKTLTAAIAGAAIALLSTVIVNTINAALNTNGTLFNVFEESDIQSVFNWAYGLAGLIAVIFIVVAAISYATANGDPAKIQKAHRTILFSVIGLVVVLLAAAITNFVFITATGTS